MASDWNYRDDDPVRGPSKWAHQFPGVGKAQSPIDIQLDVWELQRHQSQRAKCSCALKLDPCAPPAPQRRQLDNRQQVAAGKRRDHFDSTGGELDEELGARSSSRSSSDSWANFSHSSAFSSPSPSPSPDGHRQQTLVQHSNHHRRHHHQNKFEIESSKQFAPTKTTTTTTTISTTKQREQQNTRFCATNKKLFLGYPRYLNSIKLRNTGHAWQIDLPAELAEHTREYTL